MRSKRLDDFVSSYEMQAEFSGAELKVENLSDSGVKLIGRQLDIQKGYSGHLIIKASNQHEVVSTMATLVWSKVIDGQHHLGLEFENFIFPREYLHSLDQLLATEFQLDQQLSDYDSIPDDYKLLIFEIENFLRNLKRQIDEIERQFETKSEEAKQSLIQALDIRFDRYVSEKLINYGKQLYTYLDHLNDKQQGERFLALFKSQLNEFYLDSPYARRALEKPLGYAGDYEMMNQVYRNGYEGNSLFGKLMHRYTVNEAAAIAVRQRREYLSKKIRDVAVNSPSGKAIKVCSVACGPAQECVDYIHKLSAETSNHVELTLIDQDIEALLEARRNITTAINTSGANVSVQCLPISVKDILKQSDKAVEFLDQQFDLIYSAGLFDYLPQDIATMLTHILAERVLSGGDLIIGNFHPNSPTRAICEFLVDWQLIYRTEEEVADLAQQLSSMKIKTLVDQQEIVVYLEARKL